jgi:hypothetical protein
MNRYQKELKTLKRENQRLRKMLQRAEETVQEFCVVDLEAELEAEIDAEEKEERMERRRLKNEKKKNRAEARGEICPDCESKTEQTKVGPLTFVFCTNKCGYRKKVK